MAILVCLLLTIAAAASESRGSSQQGPSSPLPAPKSAVQVTLENLSLSPSSITTSKVQLTAKISLTSTRNAAVEDITMDQLRANGVPFYATPIPGRVEVKANQKLELPQPLVLTVYLRDLQNLQQLRALVSSDKVSVTGVAHAKIDLKAWQEVVLMSKHARASIPISDTVELQIPGGPFGRKAALIALDAAEAGWNYMGNNWQNAARMLAEWQGSLADQYSSIVVLAYATYDLTDKKGATIPMDATAVGFRVAGRQVLLPKSVLEPWKFDPNIAWAMKKSSMKVSNYDLWIFPANARLRDDSNQLSPDKAWRLSAQQLRELPLTKDDMEDAWVADGKNQTKISVHRQSSVSALAMVEITDPAVQPVTPALAEAAATASSEPLALFRFPGGIEARDAHPEPLMVSVSSAQDKLKLDEMIDYRGWGSPLISKAGIVGIAINQDSYVPIAEAKRQFRLDSAPASPEPAVAAGSDRLAVFISDLHFGVGKEASGQWDPTEDFRWPNALQGFLDYISERGHQKVDLVILGDMLDLWQPRKDQACKSTGMDSGCTIDEMKAILATAIAAHPKELASLKAFARQGDNRLYIVPGNHDAALMVPEVWQLLAAALGADTGSTAGAAVAPAAPQDQARANAPAALDAAQAPQTPPPTPAVAPAPAAPAGTQEQRVRLVESGMWSTPDGKVMAEHGHQIGSDVNRYEKWPVVTETKNGQTYIVRSWGEHFVQSIFNEEEREYPLIDNLIPESVGARYRMAEKGMAQSSADALRFLAFDTFDSSAKAPPEVPKAGNGNADSTTARLLRLSTGVLAGQLAPDNPLRKLMGASPEDAKNAQGNGAPMTSLPGPMMVSDLQKLCAGLVGGVTAIPCGSLFGSLLQPRAEVFRTHLISRRQAFPQMTVFVYGHTHLYELPWPVALDASRTMQVINDGSFQRLIDEPGFKELAKAFAHPYEALKKITLEDLPPCYSAVLIGYKGGVPDPQVVMWKMPEDGPGKAVSPGTEGCR
jgi:hypothetical protein